MKYPPPPPTTTDSATKRIYVTKGVFDGGSNFREIARVLTEQGVTINHATARNLMVSGIRKILQSVAKKLSGKELTTEDVDALLRSPETYQVFSDILHKLYSEPKITQKETPRG